MSYHLREETRASSRLNTAHAPREERVVFSKIEVCVYIYHKMCIIGVFVSISKLGIPDPQASCSRRRWQQRQGKAPGEQCSRIVEALFFSMRI